MWAREHGPGQTFTSGRPLATEDGQENRYEDE